MKIKKFKKEQAKETRELILKCFNEFVASSFSKRGREEFIKTLVPEKLFRREDDTYIAEESGRIIGVIQGVRSCKIMLLFVDKQHQSVGVGKKLVAKLESLYRRRGIKVMTVWSSTYAIPFYEKIGYKKSGGLVRRKNGMVYQPMKKSL